MPPTNGWIAVDFDGTLAHYEHGQYPDLGKPLQPMLARVRLWVENGQEVRIFTARTSQYDKDRIQDWLEHYGLPRLDVTNCKDFDMIEIYDDRAHRIEKNTGRLMDEEIAYERGFLDGEEKGFHDGIESGTRYPHTS